MKSAGEWRVRGEYLIMRCLARQQSAAPYADVAQLAEQALRKRQVQGSTPCVGFMQNFVDVSHPGIGPFQVHEFGPRAAIGVSSFAVIRSDDPGKWPWFTCTNSVWCTAVAAALNATVAR